MNSLRTDNSEISISFLQKEDWSAIIEFQNKWFGEHRTLDKFEDQYVKNEFGTGIYVVAKKGNKIIGTQSLLPYTFRNGLGEELKTGKSEDTIVHPAYRGTKITNMMYAHLCEAAEAKGYEVIWGFSHLSEKFFKSNGFKLPFQSDLLINIKGIKAAYLFVFNSNLWNFKKRLYLFYQWLWSSKSYNEKGIQKFQNKEISVFEYFKVQIEKDKNTFTCAFEHSEFITHRFYLIIDEKGNIIGKYAIDFSNRNCCFLSELIIENSNVNPSILNFISNAALEECGINIYWAFDNPMNKKSNQSLQKVGFFPFKSGVNLCWKNLNNSNVSADSFHFSRMLSLFT